MLLASGQIVRLILLAVILWGLWYVLWRPRWEIRIQVDEHGVRSHSGLSRYEAKRLLAFLEEMQFSGRATIYAVRQKNGRLRAQFQGAIEADQQQRIRNFLVNVL